MNQKVSGPVYRLCMTVFMVCLIRVSYAQTIAQEQKLAWWKEAKFGMFLHWGLYSVAAGEWNGHAYKGNEHFMLYEKIPVKTYGEIARRFDPVAFDADAWVRMARDAGMKYVVITAKHHDGFAMYRSPSSHYNVVEMSPFGKDPMLSLAAACRKYGLRLCFYYSLGRDWQDPDVPTNWPVKAGRSNTWDFPDEDHKDFAKYFERKVKPQIRELLTQYGPVGVIWFDTPELISRQQSEELAALVHGLQPGCIINSRIGHGMGDFNVSEQKIAEKTDSAAWEACVTMSKGWGYNRFDTVWKTPELTIRQLTEIVSKGGNFLLNIGPMSNGAFPDSAVRRLRIIGEWMKINGEAIYGVHPWKMSGELVDSVIRGAGAGATATGAMTAGVEKPDSSAKTMVDAINDATSKKIYPIIRFAAKGNKLYVFANSVVDRKVTVRALGLRSAGEVRQVTMLGSASAIKWRQLDDRLEMEMPEKKEGPVNVYVFVVGM